MTAARDGFDLIPRLGWVQAPTACALAEVAGVEVTLKRDDLAAPLHGSTKLRKFDFLLAAEPWASAPHLVSVGAIGSGHLTALASATLLLGKTLDVGVFWEPVSRGVLDNLAFTAAHAAHLRFFSSRASLALRAPATLVGTRHRGAVVVPPGATHPLANLGLVRAGVELADQLRAGDVPMPRRLYVAAGSGGTIAGLAVGLALAELPIELHAVAVVERALLPAWRLRRLARATLQTLGRFGVHAPDRPAPIRIRRGFLGPGYGVPSPASTDAADRLREAGVPGEEVYTGKALACLLDDHRRDPAPSMLYFTARSDEPSDSGPAGAADRAGWRDKLPRALAERLDASPGRSLTRRAVITTAVAGAATLGLGVRACGGGLAAWVGNVLSAREAATLAAAAAALIPDTAGDPPPTGTWDDIPRGIDRFLTGTRAAALRPIHALLTAVEQLTPVSGHLATFSELDPADARAALLRVDTLGRPGALIVRGLRDLCMLGYWQAPETWPSIGYDGPRVAAPRATDSNGRDGRPRPASRYDHLLAPHGPPAALASRP